MFCAVNVKAYPPGMCAKASFGIVPLVAGYPAPNFFRGVPRLEAGGLEKLCHLPRYELVRVGVKPVKKINFDDVSAGPPPLYDDRALGIFALFVVERTIHALNIRTPSSRYGYVALRGVAVKIQLRDRVRPAKTIGQDFRVGLDRECSASNNLAQSIPFEHSAFYLAKVPSSLEVVVHLLPLMGFLHR